MNSPLNGYQMAMTNMKPTGEWMKMMNMDVHPEYVHLSWEFVMCCGIFVDKPSQVLRRKARLLQYLDSFDMSMVAVQTVGKFLLPFYNCVIFLGPIFGRGLHCPAIQRMLEKHMGLNPPSLFSIRWKNRMKPLERRWFLTITLW